MSIDLARWVDVDVFGRAHMVGCGHVRAVRQSNSSTEIRLDGVNILVTVRLTRSFDNISEVRLRVVVIVRSGLPYRIVHLGKHSERVGEWSLWSMDR